MKFEKTRVFNFDGAFRGMRNPLNSHHLSDSLYGFESNFFWQVNSLVDAWVEHEEDHKCLSISEADLFDKYRDWLYDNSILHEDENEIFEFFLLGPKDAELALKLIKGGPEHRKFLRQICVSVDITAPIYLWKEIDTYKVGTVANSTSTMHKLASTPITFDCFETDDYVELDEGPYNIINYCETLRRKYVETNDKRYWKELIRWLPEGFSQTRTWTCNYETLLNIYYQRHNHKLTEWHTFCNWIENLPYMKLFLNKEKINEG